MQMIDLSGVKDFNAARFLIYWLVATVIAILVAYNIDPQKKLVWFRQRSDNGFMVRRGWFGNFSLLGVPRSKMGFAITAGIFIGGYCVGAAYLYDSSGTRLSCVSLVFPY